MRASAVRTAGARRTRPRRRARHRAVQQQPDRSRSWPAEGPATADARTQTLPLGRTDRRRPRVRAEPPPRPLRTRHRRPATAAPRDSIHRARSGESELHTRTSRRMPGPPERNRAGWLEPRTPRYSDRVRLRERPPTRTASAAAIAASRLRDATPSLPRMDATWCSTVRRDRTSRAAMAESEVPARPARGPPPRGWSARRGWLTGAGPPAPRRRPALRPQQRAHPGGGGRGTHRSSKPCTASAISARSPPRASASARSNGLPSSPPDRRRVLPPPGDLRRVTAGRGPPGSAPGSQVATVPRRHGQSSRLSARVPRSASASAGSSPTIQAISQRAAATGPSRCGSPVPSARAAARSSGSRQSPGRSAPGQASTVSGRIVLTAAAVGWRSTSCAAASAARQLTLVQQQLGAPAVAGRASTSRGRAPGSSRGPRQRPRPRRHAGAGRPPRGEVAVGAGGVLLQVLAPGLGQAVREQPESRRPVAADDLRGAEVVQRVHPDLGDLRAVREAVQQVDRQRHPLPAPGQVGVEHPQLGHAAVRHREGAESVPASASTASCPCRSASSLRAANQFSRDSQRCVSPTRTRSPSAVQIRSASARAASASSMRR